MEGQVTLAAEVRAALMQSPASVALVTPAGQVLSRGDLAAMLDGFAQVARASAAQPGHRLAVLLPDHWVHPVLTLALCDLVSVFPLNPGLTDTELTAALSAAQASALLAPGGDPRAQALASRLALPLWRVDLEQRQPVVQAGGWLPPLPRPVGLVLATSGSTGTPKRVPIRPEAMVTSARSIAATLALGPGDRAVHSLPMFHIGAVVDLFLAPLLSGGSLVVADGPAPADLTRAIRDGHGTWVQLVPTMLARVLAEVSDADRDIWADQVRWIRSVSADLGRDRQAEAEARLRVPIIQMYGMTETAGQICSNPAPPGDRRAGTVGPPAGCEVQLLDQTGSPVPAGQEGEVCLRGPTVMQGYEGGPEAEHFHGPWLRSGDLGRFDDAGYLELTGRLKEQINRGGEKISPTEVERAALLFPGVTEAAAYGLPHPTLGEQVGLSVVGAALDEAALLAHLAAHLAAHKCPRKVVVLDRFPRLGSGKVDRLALAGRRAEAVRTKAQGPMATMAGRVWQDVLKGPFPAADEDFFDAGGDSLSAVQFLMALEQALGHTVDPNLLYAHPRFGAMVEALERAAPLVEPAGDPAFVGFIKRQMAGWPGARAGPRGLLIGQRQTGDLPPAFVATQGEYPAFVRGLNADRPVYLMRTLRGVRGKSDAMTRDLARIYAAEISQVYPQGPVLMAGFCEGAKLTDMVAQDLQAQGRVIAPMLSVDYRFADPVPWGALHVWSDSYRFFRRPEPGVQQITRGGAEVVALPGKHGASLKHPVMAQAFDRIEALWTGTDSLPPVASPFDMAGRAAMYRAGLAPRRRWLFRPGQTSEQSITVTNQSTKTWPGGGQFSVTVDAFNLDGHVRAHAMGHAPLDDPLGPGQSRTLRLRLDHPDVRVPLILRYGMADEGIARFLNDRRPWVSRLIWPWGR